ncbi:cobyrinate a,c-diamide synthase [Nocardioides marmoraquaticus]
MTTGVIAALARRGLAVSGHKVGPDYIDPGYHALASGRPGRNLDPHLCGPDAMGPLLLHGSRGADVAVVEGVMGLFDGRVGTDGFSSTAHVATLTRSPVVLVVDVSRASRSLGAVVHGMATYDPTVDVVGVVLNQVSSPRMAEEVRRAMRLPVLGALPRDAEVTAPSRHLGLVPAAERGLAADALDRLAEQVEAHVDLDALLDLARSAPALDGEPWDPGAALGGAFRTKSPRHADLAGADRSETRPVVAVAGGRAFTFRYAETEELLRAAGCEPVAFDPMGDVGLPAGTRGVYLGGGFPEVHAAELTGNEPLRRELAEAVRDGVPTVAECAGLLYLADTLDGAPMVGAVPAAAAMHERLTLRYPEAVAPADTLLTRAGERVTGHEFHRTRTDPGHGPTPAWVVDGVAEGFAGPTLHASYLHTHWAGHPRLAARFAQAVHEHA